MIIILQLIKMGRKRVKGTKYNKISKQQKYIFLKLCISEKKGIQEVTNSLYRLLSKLEFTTLQPRQFSSFTKNTTKIILSSKYQISNLKDHKFSGLRIPLFSYTWILRIILVLALRSFQQQVKEESLRKKIVPLQPNQ